MKGADVFIGVSTLGIVSREMAASYAIAPIVSDEELSGEYILPFAFDERIGKMVAKAVANAARKTKVARIWRGKNGTFK